MSADNGVVDSFQTALNEPWRSLFIADQFERASFQAADDAEQYILENLSQNLQKKSKRLYRRLEEMAPDSQIHVPSQATRR